MVARRISGSRPRLLAALFESRQFEIERSEPRYDLLEFVTFCLLAELQGQAVAVGPSREPLLIMLAALSMKYDHPKVIRDLTALVREGMPL